MNTNMNKDRLRELEDLLTDECGWLDVELVSMVKHFIEQEVVEARREAVWGFVKWYIKCYGTTAGAQQVHETVEEYLVNEYLGLTEVFTELQEGREKD